MSSLSSLWAGVLLLAFVALIFLVPLSVDIRHQRLFILVSNAAHLPILAGTTAVLFLLGFARRSLPWLGLIGCATAALLEAVQPLFGRTASLADLALGCLGVGCALSAVAVWRPGRHRALRWGHGVLMLAIMTATLVPAWNEWQNIRWRDHMFPVLADFEDEAGLSLWEIRGGTRDQPSSLARSEDFASSGRMGLRVQMGAGSRAALVYAAGSKNWDPYETLRFDVFNPGPPFRLGLLIDDCGNPMNEQSRYARVFNLEAGLSEFRLPISNIRRGQGIQALDMTRICLLSLFPRIGEPPREYFLDGLRLE